MTYTIDYLESVIRDDIPKLSQTHATRIRKAIEQKLTHNPLEFGKPLRYSLKGARCLRVGDHRVVFVIDKTTVLVVKIGHRREVYGGH